jgi:hypothetical protein
MVERLAFLLDGVPEAERIARCRDRLCAKIVHSQSLTQKPTSPDHRLPLTAFETHNGRSTFATGTALHAPQRSPKARMIMGWFCPPFLPFAVRVGIGSIGWISAVRDLPGLTCPCRPRYMVTGAPGQGSMPSMGPPIRISPSLRPFPMSFPCGPHERRRQIFAGAAEIK